MTAAKAGAWGKTAQRLNTTHPAVSRTIEELDLEDAIGVRLLDRSRPRARADPWSRAAPLTQRQFFDDLRQAVRNIAFHSDPTLGEIKIGGK
jgi:DNA-binding transcriptional LysR family regulator